MSDFEQKLSSIGEIFQDAQVMKKSNRNFERKSVRQLRKINRELRGLNNIVKDEMNATKKAQQEMIVDAKIELDRISRGINQREPI